jgi:hypothetical protein
VTAKLWKIPKEAFWRCFLMEQVHVWSYFEGD